MIDRLREFLVEDDRPRIGRYRMIREIGRGGMSTVFEAEDTELRRRVALKIVRSEEATLSARLYREAAIAAQLRHPNIVTVHEVGVARDSEGELVHFLAMDLIEGRTLNGLLDEPVPKLLEILELIARAVHHMHLLGIVHRDLKPSNILVDASGRPVLTDFGLALAGFFSARLTMTGEVFGTPQYMAPEQAEGKTRRVDARADVYALGVILYEILTGHVPYEAASLGELCVAILAGNPEPPSRRSPAVSAELECVCLKAMERLPEHRYGTALEFAEEIARYRRGEPVLARPISVAARIWRRAVRHRSWLIPTAASIVLAGVAFGWARIAMARKAEMSRQTEVYQDRERRRQDAIVAFESVRMSLERLKVSSKLEGPQAKVDDPQLERLGMTLAAAIAQAPDLAIGYDLRGVLLQMKGESDAAIEEFTRAIRLDPGYLEALLHRAAAYDRKGNPEAARADCDAALERNPNSSSAYLLRARLRKQSGDLQGSVADLDNTIRITPGNIIARVSRASTKLAMGDPAGALQDAEAALALSPSFPQAIRVRDQAKRSLDREAPAGPRR